MKDNILWRKNIEFDIINYKQNKEKSFLPCNKWPLQAVLSSQVRSFYFGHGKYHQGRHGIGFELQLCVHSTLYLFNGF